MRKPLWEEKSKQCWDYLLTKSHVDKKCQKSHYKEIPAEEWSFICVHGSENIQYMIRVYGYARTYIWWVDSPFPAILFMDTNVLWSLQVAARDLWPFNTHLTQESSKAISNLLSGSSHRALLHTFILVFITSLCINHLTLHPRDTWVHTG